MALDRLDAVVIGANVEGLAAAAVLAQAGRAVAVVERRPEGTPEAGEGGDAVVSLDFVRRLDLGAHGLRLAAPPPVAVIGSGGTMMLWPGGEAADAIAPFSARDASAFEAFAARVHRAALSPAIRPVSAWLTTQGRLPSGEDDLRVFPLARILDESFDHELLKGTLALGAVEGTGASPFTAGTAALLTRQTVLQTLAPESGHRFVAGGRARLREALLALLRFYNNADVHFSSEVTDIPAERDAAAAVVLADGTSLRAPLLVSAASAARSLRLVTGLRRTSLPPLPARPNVEPGVIHFVVSKLPAFPGIDTETLAAGAVVRLNPSLARLKAAHALFRARAFPADPCIEVRVRPHVREGKLRWKVCAAISYVPLATVDGPWTGSRRDRLRALCVRALDDVSPGFGGSVEHAEIVSPEEAATVMDPKGAAALAVRTALDPSWVPQPGEERASVLIRGLTLLRPGPFEGAGEAGIAGAEQAISSSRVRADA